MLFTMNVTAFAAETQENYSETEKTMTFEITPTALTSGSSRHSVGMLNSFFGTNDTVATSALGSFTISSTSVPSGSTISKIVVTSTKSSGSSGNIELFVAKDEDNGDGTFDRYTDSKSWNSSLTFAGIIELVYIVLQSVVKPGITGFFKIDLHIKCYIYLS